jgi:hypothetical protein
MERVTLDMTAVRDILEDERPRHRLGLELLDHAACGAVELGVPPQGIRADLSGFLHGDLAPRIRMLVSAPGVVELPQIARMASVTLMDENLLMGSVVPDFAEAWKRVVNTWKTHQGGVPGDLDRWYVETHMLCGREVLVTDDRALRAMCGRLQSEHGLAVQAETILEYTSHFRTGIS